MLSRLRSFMDQWIISLQTYPLTHLIVLIMTVIWMIAIEQDYNSVIMDTLLKVLATGALTLPFTLIQSNRNKYLPLGAVALGLGYWLLLPSQIENIVYSQQLWIIGSIIITWIIPSVVLAWDHRDSQDLTWSQFTHRWMSLAQGVIGGLILWGGIAASLASIEFLFDVTIHSNIYQHIGVISVLCVGTWIWLINLQQRYVSPLTRGGAEGGGVLEELGEVSYPRWMRIFGQYIFLPLCVIYGLILIAYGMKILATGTWPQGQLVYMVAGYVGFGLMTWFFLLPLERGNLWLSKSYRALFISFVVTSGLMIGALIMRVQQYGWTIDRGIVVALIIWIIVMGVGSLIWTSKRWIIGLTSLMVLGLVSVIIIPPVIKSYHISQAQSLLTTAKTNTGDASKLYESLDYLADNYGTGRLNKVVSPEQMQLYLGSSNQQLAEHIMSNLNITGEKNSERYDVGVDHYASRYGGNYLTITTQIPYSKIIQLYGYNLPPGISFDKGVIKVSMGDNQFSINLQQYVDNLIHEGGSASPYVISGNNYQLTLTTINYIQNYYLTGTSKVFSGGNNIDGFEGYLLLK